ncbi:C-lectin, putative [Bodo saltans]|uniref:C-lectin, putative n=1 Tax=Bodo saltans TaxID=75058 RepID=A0A0S4JA94_BODSA|nr:C-lectin, putative [Bodo saltans]|eukprot:CUG87135.1 C-lectin, putative [Bodo saltans]
MKNTSIVAVMLFVSCCLVHLHTGVASALAPNIEEALLATLPANIREGSVGGAASLSATAAAASCPSTLYELDTLSGIAYVKAVGQAVDPLFSVAPSKGRLTISLWTQLSLQQNNDMAVLFQVGAVVPIPNSNYTRFGDSLTLYWSSTDAAVVAVLNNNVTVDGSMPVQTIVTDDGTMPLNTNQYHNVMVILDAVMGYIVILVDSVPTAVVAVPSLAVSGFVLNGNLSGISIGADYQGLNNAVGSFADLTLVPDLIGVEDAKYMALFRMPMDMSNSSSSSPMCLVAPCNLDTVYPFHGINVSTFYFTTAGFSFPNSTLMSPYIRFGLYPLYKSPFALRQQLFAVANITSPSWTPLQFAQSRCGGMQFGTIVFPDPTVAYNVKFWLTANSTPPIGSTLNITTSDGKFLTSYTVTSIPTSAPKIEFVYQNYQLVFNISSTFSDFCIGFSAVSERPPVIATPHSLFSTESSPLNIIAGVGPWDTVALSSNFNCYNVPMTQVLTLVPFYKFDALAYFTVTIPELTTPGLNVLCVYPNGTMPPSGQAYAAGRCPTNDNTDTFLCGLSVAQLPTGAIPLASNWVTNLLHLGSQYTDAIWHGVFETDYFFNAGGERKILPQAGDVLDMTSELLVWTPMTRPDGLWGTMDGNKTLSYSEPEWVQYMALSVYSSTNLVTSLSIRACSAVKVYVDGVNVYQLSPTSLANNSDSTSTVYHSSTFTLRTGWHQVMIKLWRAPSVYTSVFSLRFDQSSGLSWLFQYPTNTSSNTSYANTCAGANRTIACVPGAAGLNTSHSECVAMGCCYDPSNTGNVCFSSSAPAVNYRTDGHCGLGWPSTISNISVCNPRSSTGSSCCSAFEWCGSTFAHCNCATCTNSIYVGLGGHCNYLPWGTQARCLGSRIVPMGAMTDADCRAECDVTTGCIGYQTSIVNFAQTCNLVFSTAGSCPRTIKDTTVARLYVKSCNQCNFNRNTSMQTSCTAGFGVVSTYGTGAPNPAAFMTLSQCQVQCTKAVACVGVQYNTVTGLCQFLATKCPAANIQPNNFTTLSMYTCSGDNQIAPVPLPQVPNSTNITALGCYADYTRGFLSSSTFGTFDATNQYKNFYMPNIANLTIDKCIAKCWALGAPYAAMTAGTICTCGVRLPETAPAPSEQMCTTVCPGNSSEVCGGPTAASVFRVNYAPGVCPSGFVYFSGNCYQYFGRSGGNDMMSWHDARIACNSLGASLASVHSVTENAFVLSFAAFYNSSNTRIAWLGGYQYPADNTYQWEDGSPWDFADWRYNEPNAKLYEESCATVFSNYPTPYKGSFNDDNCLKPYPYICKMPATGSSVYPSIYATIVDGNINCAPMDAMAEFNRDLAAWYEFDDVSNYSSIVVLDQSANRRDIRFNTTVSSASGGNATTVGATPTFVPGIVNKAVVMNGSSFFTMQPGPQSYQWDVRTNEITVSAWILQSDSNNNANQIIVSKSYSPDAADVSIPQFEWALAFQNGALCFIIGPYRACAAAPELNVWTQVVGSFDGTLIHIALNGTLISTYDTVLNDNVTFYFPKNPNTTVVIGYRSATPLDTTRMFRGLLDDLRIFGEAINIVQSAYLLYCTPTGSPSNVVYVYDEVPSAIVLAGEGLGLSDQSFALSTLGCAPGTPVYMSAAEQVFQLDSMFAALSPPGIPTLPYNATSMMTPVYSVCHVNQLDRAVIYGDTFFKIAVTTITSVNGYMQQLTVNNTQFPLMLELVGLQLAPGQILATTMDSDCSLLDAVYPITDINAAGTTGYVTIQRPALISDTIHLCWGSSAYALGEASADNPVGIASGDNLKNTGITILMMDPNGLQYKAIAIVDGTTAITATTILTGMSGSLTNFFLECSDANYFGDNFIAMVTMGVYEDYLIPNKGVSVCQLLTGYAFSSTHSYTANNPLAPTYLGDAVQVPPTQSWTYLGGSPYGFPTDGRQYLSAWGTYYANSANIGGYGQAAPQQIPEWFQAYNIIIWAVPNTTTYLNVALVPTLFVPGAYFAIEAQLLDNHNDLVKTPVSFMLTIGNNIVPPMTIASTDGQLRYNASILTNDTVFIGVSFPITITVVLPEGSPLVVSNGATWTSEAFMGGSLPAGVTPINPAMGLTSFLHFGALNESVPSPYFFSGMYDDWFAQYGGEASMRPAENQTYTAESNFFSIGDNVNRTYMWQVVTNPTGYWRDTASPDSVQFFAGAFYSPMQQTIRIQYSCDDGVAIYVDGAMIVQTFAPANNSRSDVISVGPGYHQLFIKLVNQFTLSLIEIKLQGTGLGWTSSVPPELPDGTQLLSNNVPLIEALRLGPDVFVGTFGEDFINETTVRPALGVEVVPGVSWLDSIAGNGSWVINASTLTGMQSMAISYLALGIYAPVDMSVVFQMNVPSQLAIWYDGTNVIRVDGTQMPVYTDYVFISAGWHQVLIKIAAAAGTVQTYSLTPTGMTGVLAWALSPAYNLPIGVRPIQNGAPLRSLMILQTNASMPLPSSSSDVSQAVSFIPYGPASNNSVLTYPDFSLTQYSQLEPYDSIPIAAAPNSFFEWTPATLGTDVPATWGSLGMGGMFNSYYAVTLYASSTMSGVNVMLDSIGANYALWMDDQLLTSNSLAGTSMSASNTISITVPQGYHQLVLKQQVPSDFTEVSTGGARLTWAAANTLCHSNARRQVCSYDAYCPYGSPRQGVVPVMNGSFFMPYRDVTNGWVQTGTGGNDTQMCETWVQSHGTSPSWGTDSSTAYPFRGTVGCCGAFASPAISISVDATNAMSSSSNAALGWMFGFPQVEVAAPIIYSNNVRARTQTITINTTTPGAVIYYTLDFTTPTRSAIRYTGPFNVSQTTFIMAIAYLNTMSSSYISYYQISILPTPVVDRTMCIANAACYVPIASADPGSMYSFVSTSWNYTMLAKVLDSTTSAWLLPTSSYYSGVLTLQGDNSALVPALAAGPYYVVSYDGTGRGSTIATMFFSPVVFTPSQVVGSAATLFSISGGIQSGDGIIFLTPQYPANQQPTCSASNCARAFADFPSQILTVTNQFSDFVTTVDLSRFTGTISCACVCATGAMGTPGVIMPKNFILVEEIASAIPMSIQVQAPNPAAGYVSSVSPMIVADDGVLTLSGNYSNNVTTAYTVQLVGASAQPTTMKIPTCSITFVNASVVLCSMSVRQNTSGQWLVNLYFRGEQVTNKQVFSITAVPPMPSVTGATGACTQMSKNCVTGSVLMFYGANFDLQTPSDNDIIVGPSVNSGVTCPVLNVTSTYIACTLVVSSSAPSGTYPVSLALYVSSSYTLTVSSGAAIILGAGSSPGWNGGNAPSNTPAPGGSPQGNSPKSDDDKTAIIAGTLSAIVVLLVAVLLIVRFKYSFVPKAVQQSKEMDYIEEQLMEDTARRGDTSPRVRQASLEPEPVREQGQSRYTAPEQQGSINNM